MEELNNSIKEEDANLENKGSPQSLCHTEIELFVKEEHLEDTDTMQEVTEYQPVPVKLEENSQPVNIDVKDISEDTFMAVKEEKELENTKIDGCMDTDREIREVTIKNEIEDSYQCEDQNQGDAVDIEIKIEPYFSMTEGEDGSHLMQELVENSEIINTESILPTTVEQEGGKSNNKEEIFNDMFQLNSITSDLLPLQAYGLLEATSAVAEKDDKIKCSKCSKVMKAASVNRHLKAHESIEKRANGVLKGLQTKAKKKEATNNLNKDKYVLASEGHGRGSFECLKCHKGFKMKKCFLSHTKNCTGPSPHSGFGVYSCFKCHKSFHLKKYALEHQKICLSIKTESVADKNMQKKSEDQYLCPCGKSFHRRSRMETCLRSHSFDSAPRSCFSCIACAKQFKDKGELTLHKKKHHVKKRFACKFCPTDYHTPKELFKHLRKHQKVQLMEYKVISDVVNGKQELNCFMCKKSCKFLSDLKMHVLGDHKEPYSCPQCNKKFPNIVDFASHTKSTHPEVEGQSVLDVLEAFSKLAECWKCEECDLQFDQPEKLAMHQAEQHTQKAKSESVTQQFQCQNCSRVFITAKRLSTHRRMIHNDVSDTSNGVLENSLDTSLMCLHCRKVCKDENALTSHMRLHSPERKYVCKFCDFRFATMEKRRSHAAIHTGDMKFVCFICDYVCTSENRLKAHKISPKHLQMKESLLSAATVPFVAQNGHTSTSEINKNPAESNEPTTCNVCGEEFPSESEMQDHKQTHPFIEFPNEDCPTRIFFK